MRGARRLVRSHTAIIFAVLKAHIVLHLLIGGRPETRLGSKYNLLCGNSWTRSVPALVIEGTLQSASGPLSTVDIAELT